MQPNIVLTFVLCDGRRVCDKCRAENALCDYSHNAGSLRNRQSPYVFLVAKRRSLLLAHIVRSIGLLEEQNRQLRDTVQKLYEYLQTGHILPDLLAPGTGDGHPLLHDIVAYVRELPMGATSRHGQVQYQISGPNAAPLVPLPRSQPETSPCPGFIAAAPQLNTVVASMQQDLSLPDYDPAQTDYESLGSRLDLQEVWSLMEIDPAGAAGLGNWLLNYTA
jgi:hypothetical protein